MTSTKIDSTRTAATANMTAAGSDVATVSIGAVFGIARVTWAAAGVANLRTNCGAISGVQ